jgi:hypothetical protein
MEPIPQMEANFQLTLRRSRAFDKPETSLSGVNGRQSYRRWLRGPAITANVWEYLRKNNFALRLYDMEIPACRLTGSLLTSPATDQAALTGCARRTNHYVLSAP